MIEVEFDVTNALVYQVDSEDKSLGEKWGRFLVLGLALLYVGMSLSSIGWR